jgi:Fe-S-cluster-containing dehydrogenase component
VCPVGATYVTNGGVVVINEEKCIGCGLCQGACPFGARYMTAGAGGKKLVDKCDLCYKRIRRGEQPVCSEVCPAHAITFGSRDELLAKANGATVYGKAELGGLGVLIILKKELQRYELPQLG